MKFNWGLFFIVSVFMSGPLLAHADPALETDDSFFKSEAPVEDDDLDRKYKKNELVKSRENQNKIESHVKDEFSSIQQGIMPAYEAQMMDQKIVAENKRRQTAIMRSLNKSAGAVRVCVSQKDKVFQGTHATVIWMIQPNGTVSDTAIKSTDIDNPEVQRCIQEVAASLDFSTAKTELLNKSLVEYTYKFKFKKKANTSSFKKKMRRSTASQ